jgi:PAS domain S-box-containing protein
MFILGNLQVQNLILETFIDSFFLTIFAGLSIWRTVYLPEKEKLLATQNVSEKFCNELIEGIGKIALISITDREGKISFANENFTKAAEYSEQELIGKTHKMVNSGSHSKEFFQQMWKTIKEEKIWSGEIKNKRKSGEEYWLKTFILQIDNSVKQFIGFQFDITEEKLLSEALMHEQLKNIHVDRLAVLGEMAGGISHEINNPLAAISGLVTMTEQYFKKMSSDNTHSKEIERFSKIQNHVHRIKKIVDALKEFSRNGENTEARETINLQHIINVIHDLNHEKIKDKGITFSINIRDISFKCNVAQIEEVIATLVTNSIDAIQDLVTKWIKIESHINGDFLEISVIDSGTGISDTIALKIMQPFFTTKEVGKGTGLGLSIARYIVDSHAGKLFIDKSSLNTKFVVRLPLNENPMLDLLNAEQAIEAHLAWRQKILTILNKKENLPDENIVGADDKCELGRWIKKVDPQFQDNQMFYEMKKSHAEFHRCAAKIIARIRQGDDAISDVTIGSGSEFDCLSNKVISCLKKLKRPKDENHQIQAIAS